MEEKEIKKLDQGDYSPKDLKPLFDSKNEYYFYTEIIKKGFRL